MRNNKILKSIGFVTLSNIIKLVSSIFVGFILPGILGVTNYGYYKVFGLYLMYIGLFHFGFIDGIYLKYGGTNYNQLDRKEFRLYFKFLLLMELILAVIGVILIQQFLVGEKKFIFSLLFINMIAINLTSYFQFVSQITSRFKEFSIRTIVIAFSNLLIVAVLFFMKSNNYRMLLIAIVAVNFLLLFWYVYTYKEIVFGIKEKFRDNKKKILLLFYSGITLLVANLASTIIINIDRQVVELYFTVEEFGTYSFAYSMLSMITVVVTAIGIVLYPSLKKIDINNISAKYSKYNRIIIFIVLIGLVGYFPIKLIIPKFLPDYFSSIFIFRIALPGLLFTAPISAVKHNYFKVFDRNLDFFLISLFAILLNLSLNIFSYYRFGSMLFIAASSVLGIMFWYIMLDLYLYKVIQIKWQDNFFIILIGMISFYSITSIDNVFISFFAYVFFVITLIIITNYKYLMNRFLKYNKR